MFFNIHLNVMILYIFSGPNLIDVKDQEFYRKLTEKKVAAVEDGIRIAVIYLEGKDNPNYTSDDRLNRLKAEEIIGDDWKTKLSKPLEAKTFTYLIYKLLKLKGGLTTRVFGASERYAYRECISLGLVKANGENRYISGQEMLGVIKRVKELEKRVKSREDEY